MKWKNVLNVYFTGSTTPQTSNQIDAAVVIHHRNGEIWTRFPVLRRKKSWKPGNVSKTEPGRQSSEHDVAIDGIECCRNIKEAETRGLLMRDDRNGFVVVYRISLGGRFEKTRLVWVKECVLQQDYICSQLI